MSAASAAARIIQDGRFDDGDTIFSPPPPFRDRLDDTLREVPLDDSDTLVDPPDAVETPGGDITLREAPKEEPRLSRETAGLIAEYRFRRLQGHQAGCQCQSRGERVGCRELRARLLVVGLWQVLYDEAPKRGPSGHRATP